MCSRWTSYSIRLRYLMGGVFAVLFLAACAAAPSVMPSASTPLAATVSPPTSTATLAAPQPAIESVSGGQVTIASGQYQFIEVYAPL